MSDGKVPLKTILQRFIAHVASLEKKFADGDDQYDREFQNLKMMSENLKTLEEYSCSEGEKDHNRRKNRYKDILPFDYSRVILRPYAGVPGSDYINANYIRGASGSVAYIASQGPLSNTLADFWRMIVECEVRVIVMACSERESGKHKCECYWPTKEDDEKVVGNVKVTLVKTRQVSADFTLRTLNLKYSKPGSDELTEERVLCQFHYFAWPDHGVPLKVRPLIDMVLLLRDCQSSETCPVLVHCSAGCGRTGTICAIDYVWGLLRTGRLRENFNLFDVIAEMRKQRIAMVQTKDQYILVHRAVKELFSDQLRMIESHPYENVDVNGEPLGLSGKNDTSTSSLSSSLSSSPKLAASAGEREGDACVATPTVCSLPTSVPIGHALQQPKPATSYAVLETRSLPRPGKVRLFQVRDDGGGGEDSAVADAQMDDVAEARVGGGVGGEGRKDVRNLCAMFEGIKATPPRKPKLSRSHSTAAISRRADGGLRVVRMTAAVAAGSPCPREMAGVDRASGFASSTPQLHPLAGPGDRCLVLRNDVVEVGVNGSQGDLDDGGCCGGDGGPSSKFSASNLRAAPTPPQRRKKTTPWTRGDGPEKGLRRRSSDVGLSRLSSSPSHGIAVGVAPRASRVDQQQLPPSQQRQQQLLLQQTSRPSPQRHHQHNQARPRAESAKREPDAVAVLRDAKLLLEKEMRAAAEMSQRLAQRSRAAAAVSSSSSPSPKTSGDDDRPVATSTPPPPLAAMDAIVRSCEDYLRDAELARRPGPGAAAGGAVGGRVGVPKNYEVLWPVSDEIFVAKQDAPCAEFVPPVQTNSVRNSATDPTVHHGPSRLRDDDDGGGDRDRNWTSRVRPVAANADVQSKPTLVVSATPRFPVNEGKPLPWEASSGLPGGGGGGGVWNPGHQRNGGSPHLTSSSPSSPSSSSPAAAAAKPAVLSFNSVTQGGAGRAAEPVAPPRVKRTHSVSAGNYVNVLIGGGSRGPSLSTAPTPQRPILASRESPPRSAAAAVVVPVGLDRSPNEAKRVEEWLRTYGLSRPSKPAPVTRQMMARPPLKNDDGYGVLPASTPNAGERNQQQKQTQHPSVQVTSSAPPPTVASTVANSGPPARTSGSNGVSSATPTRSVLGRFHSFRVKLPVAGGGSGMGGRPAESTPPPPSTTDPRLVSRTQPGPPLAVRSTDSRSAPLSVVVVGDGGGVGGRPRHPAPAPAEPVPVPAKKTNLTRNRTLIGIGSLRAAQARSQQRGRPSLVLQSRQQYV